MVEGRVAGIGAIDTGKPHGKSALETANYTREALVVLFWASLALVNVVHTYIMSGAYGKEVYNLRDADYVKYREQY
jgi:hypothetical protein